MQKIQIILADDHQMFRDGIRSVLSDELDIQIIGEASDGVELISMIAECAPQIIISDITMPGISGLEVTQKITSKYPCIKVLILSMHANEEFIMNAIKAGASGYITKEAGRTELLKAIRAISAGDEYFTNDVSQIITKSFIKGNKAVKPDKAEVALTPRELEIIRYVADGLMNKEIAEKLCISIRTVDTHKNNILTKLNLKSSVELVKYAIKNDIIQL